MIGYVTVGSTDLEKSAAFYDPIIRPLGWERLFTSQRMTFYSEPKGGLFAVCAPYDKGACSFGNGVMIGFQASSAEQVDAVYAEALKAGAADEGAPGFRTPVMYIGYFRDPDGNKLAVYHLIASEAAFAQDAHDRHGVALGPAMAWE